MGQLFEFLIPDLRLEGDPSTPVGRSGCRCWTHRHGGEERSDALLRVPVVLSYKVTTHVNIVVTAWQEINRHIFGRWNHLSFGGDLLYFPA